jgi:pimeloyl-ACP methyl ester carboxylesterase
MTSTAPDTVGAAAAPALHVERTTAASGPGARVVVCVHGSMDRHASFARLRARLVPTCDVVVYDRRGYAASREVRPPASGIDDHVRDLEGVLEGVLDGREAILVGHSYGGDIALAFVERRPDLVTSAVIFEPPLPWLDVWHAPGAARGRPPWSAPTPEQAAERFLRRMIGDHRYERIPAATRAELVKDGPALVAELTAIRVGPPPFDPCEIPTTVVVACGSESAERHLAGTRWLADALPNGEHRVVAGAAHGAHRSHSRELAELVLELVSRADRGRASS